MATSEAVKLEREKRKSSREARIFDLLSLREITVPLMAVGGAVVIQKLGQSRIINRDFAGFMLATWTGVIAAQAGVTDRYALAAISATAAAAYAVATPPTEEEALVTLPTISLSKALGGDGKLFWWDMPFAGPTD